MSDNDMIHTHETKIPTRSVSEGRVSLAHASGWDVLPDSVKTFGSLSLVVIKPSQNTFSIPQSELPR